MKYFGKKTESITFRVYFGEQLIQRGFIGNLEVDNYGQLVIYTNLKIDEHTGKLRELQEADLLQK